MLDNHTNPFNSPDERSFLCRDAKLISLQVYELTGGEAAELVYEIQKVGNHVTVLNTEGITSGVYYWQIAGNSISTKIIKNVKPNLFITLSICKYNIR